MSKIVLNLETLAKINSFASKDAARYYLNGVRFHYREEHKDFVLVATDGMKLVVASPNLTWDGESFESFTLASSDILPLSAFDESHLCSFDDEECAGGRTFVPTVHVAVDTVKQTISFLQDGTVPIGSRSPDDIIHNGLTRRLSKVEGAFPIYEKIIPCFSDLGPLRGFCVNADFLTCVANLSHDRRAVFLSNKSDFHPHVAIVKSGLDSYVCVLMPVKEELPNNYPPFVKLAEETT